MHFQEKNRPFFPVQEPPLFFGHTALLGIPDVPDDLLDSHFFTFKGKPLKCTVFSRLKRSVSKNIGLKQ